MEHDLSREKTLYVTNLDDRVTEEILYELFLQAGPINSLNIKKQQTYQFAFVEFKHEESVPYALALFNGIRLFDKLVQMKPRDQTEMSKNILEAFQISRNMHDQEQLAAIVNLQHLIRWPTPPDDGTNRNQIVFYSQLAAAGNSNPMMRIPSIPSPPPPAIPFHPPPLGHWQQHVPPMPLLHQQGNGYQNRQSRQNFRDEPYRRDGNRNMNRNHNDRNVYDDRRDRGDRYDDRGDRSRSRQRNNYQQDYR